MLDVELSIDDFNVEQNSTTLVVMLGESCVLNGITIGRLLYTKAPHGLKLLAWWQNDPTATLQIPDPQMRSQYYARTEEHME